MDQERLTDDHAKRLHHDVLALVEERVFEVIPRRLYEHMEMVARRRVPRDPATAAGGLPWSWRLAS